MVHLRCTSLAFGLAATLVSSLAAAQDVPTGAPPPDATALVAAPTGPTATPELYKPDNITNVTLAAGGQYATGNSQLLAGTVNGKVDLRRGNNGFGASLLGNYGQGSTAPGVEQHVTAENLQGRVRYDRYLTDIFSVFLIDTERHDRFQGLSIRTNVDPGVKLLFVNKDTTTFWGELGYDFQYDVRRDDALVTTDATTGVVTTLSKTATQESGRAYIGFKHAFNADVSFVTGLEYLQAFTSSTPGMNSDSRLNFDALFAANVGGGFSVGAGFTTRYDHNPLPGKVKTDTATTFSLIYSFSRPAPAPAAASCPCPPSPAPQDNNPPPPPPPAPGVTPPDVPAPAGSPPPVPAPPPAPPPAPASAPPSN